MRSVKEKIELHIRALSDEALIQMREVDADDYTSSALVIVKEEMNQRPKLTISEEAIEQAIEKRSLIIRNRDWERRLKETFPYINRKTVLWTLVVLTILIIVVLSLPRWHCVQTFSAETVCFSYFPSRIWWLY